MTAQPHFLSIRQKPIETEQSRDFSWPFWPAVPLYPYGKRRTIRREVVKNRVWTFEQLQGILYVVVPIRMTVVRLAAGGLLVYAPVAATPECLRLLQELIEQHGYVKYIILPTASGIEHKNFVGPFARCFPQSQVYVTPSQWSFPLNLPLSWLGFPAKRTRILPVDSSQTPFAEQFDYQILGPIELGIGLFEEVAFFDKHSQTLLVTDSVISIPSDPPEIIQIDPYPLLFHAKDNTFEQIIDTPANRRKGWQRICLFSLYLRSSVLAKVNWTKVFREAFNAPERSPKNYFGLFPFQWQDNWQQSFHNIHQDGRLIVAPILQNLIFNRAPWLTINWADQLIKWDFNYIIPCHFDAPVIATSNQFRQAFTFLENKPFPNRDLNSNNQDLIKADSEFLVNLDKSLTALRIIPPAKGKI
jgi:hypothetical protein